MSTAAIPVHVALVDATGTIGASELAEVAGALNEQVLADFAPVWKVAASVGAYPKAPQGTWRVELRDGIPAEGAAGFHLSEHGQPYALIDLKAGDWTVSASHELLEMLADPFGSRLHSAAALTNWKGSTSKRLRYLLEVCDPCEEIHYEVGGVPLSDFLLPDYYRSSQSRVPSGYSHTGALTEPLEVLNGGYISFVDPKKGAMWQRFVVGDKVIDRELEPPNGRLLGLREWFDTQAREFRATV